MIKKQVITFLGVAALSLGLVNCSKDMSFSSEGSFSSNSSDPSGGTPTDQQETDVPVNQGGIKYPRLRLEAQQCMAGATCTVNVIADEAVQSDISAAWQTNDKAWESQPSYYARPNVHYIPAAGVFKIKAGEKSTTINVNSINWENRTNAVMTLSIPVTVSQCKMGTTANLCALFFK